MDCLEVYETIGGWREAEEVLRHFVKREAKEVSYHDVLQRVLEHSLMIHQI
jgi:hypothetical protein